MNNSLTVTMLALNKPTLALNHCCPILNTRNTEAIPIKANGNLSQNSFHPTILTIYYKNICTPAGCASAIIPSLISCWNESKFVL